MASANPTFDIKRLMIYFVLQRYPDATPAIGDSFMDSFSDSEDPRFGKELWFNHSVAGCDKLSTGCLYEKKMYDEIRKVVDGKR